MGWKELGFLCPAILGQEVPQSQYSTIITHTPEHGGTHGQESQTGCVFLAVAMKGVFPR